MGQILYLKFYFIKQCIILKDIYPNILMNNIPKSILIFHLSSNDFHKVPIENHYITYNILFKNG